MTPNKTKSYKLALLLGLLIPILYLFFSELINDKILGKTDLERLTSIPILGIVGRNYSGFALLSKQSPKSSVYEGFRSYKTNLNFLNSSKQDKEILSYFFSQWGR